MARKGFTEALIIISKLPVNNGHIVDIILLFYSFFQGFREAYFSVKKQNAFSCPQTGGIYQIDMTFYSSHYGERLSEFWSHPFGQFFFKLMWMEQLQASHGWQAQDTFFDIVKLTFCLFSMHVGLRGLNEAEVQKPFAFNHLYFPTS